MSEADRISDWGDYVTSEFDRKEAYDVYENKLHRLNKLKGSFVITTIGKDSGKLVYLQDRKISTERWWTYYLDSAIGFRSFNKAVEYIRKYKYNKSNILQVSDMMIKDAEQSLYARYCR